MGEELKGEKTMKKRSLYYVSMILLCLLFSVCVTRGKKGFAQEISEPVVVATDRGITATPEPEESIELEAAFDKKTIKLYPKESAINNIWITGEYDKIRWRRYGYLELEARLQDAQEVGFPDIVLPDINAQKIKLSEVDSKVIMVYFWTVNDAAQKMFNLDFLKSIYDDYHKKGFEIYQIALDPDKTQWAQVVKQQNLPWINVCDALGADSPYVTLYNLAALPAAFIIAD